MRGLSFLALCLEVFPQGAHLAQARDGVLEDVAHEVDVFQGGVAAQGGAQRAVRLLVRQADGQQHVAGVERTAGARRARRGADALGAQAQQHALALDELEGDVDVVGQALGGMAVEEAVGDLCGDALDGVVADGGLALVLLLALCLCQDGRLGKADDACGVFGRGALAALLAAAVDEVGDAHAAAHVEHADALGAVELVARGAHEVDAQLLDVDLLVAEGLHGVCVEDDLVGVGDGRELLDGLDGADLVVGEHDRRHDGVRADGCLEGRGIDQAVLVDVEVGDLEALLLEELGGVQDGVVLDLGGDEVLALLVLVGVHDALEGPVVCLGAAGGEEHLVGVGGVDHAGDVLTGLLDGVLRHLA